jgi:uncharacterized protein YjbI with pentapeptide repeats
MLSANTSPFRVEKLESGRYDTQSLHTTMPAEVQSMPNVDYEQADLQEVDLSGKNLEGSSFRYADLTNALLIGSNLRGCDFTGANLERAVLAFADVEDAIFDGCSLKDATLFDPLPYLMSESAEVLEDVDIGQVRAIVLTDDNSRELAKSSTAQFLELLSGFTGADFGESTPVIHEHSKYTTISGFGGVDDSGAFYRGDKSMRPVAVGATFIDSTLRLPSKTKASYSYRHFGEGFNFNMSKFIRCEFKAQKFKGWMPLSLAGGSFEDCSFTKLKITGTIAAPEWLREDNDGLQMPIRAWVPKLDTIERVVFKNCIFRDMHFENTKLFHVSFEDCVFKGRCIFEYCRFEDSEAVRCIGIENVIFIDTLGLNQLEIKS